MELQWPLILFTTLVAWSAGTFGTQGILALRGGARRSQAALVVVSAALLALSGIAVFFHLEHWERIFNGFGHLSSGITQELIAVVAFAAVAVAYFACLRRSGEGAVPKWAAVLAVAASLVLVAVCAHSYVMAARPAWDSVLEVLSVVGASCILGPATVAVVMALRGDDVSACGTLALAGAAIGAVCIVAYAAFLQASGGSFVEVGYYFDPTHPTAAMADPEGAVGGQVGLLWLGAVAVGAAVPLVAAFLGRRCGTAGAWKVWGSVGVACALVGAVCLRVAFYELGLSVFMFY